MNLTFETHKKTTQVCKLDNIYYMYSI